MAGQTLHAVQCAACGNGPSSPEEPLDRAGLGVNLSILLLLTLIYGLASIIAFKVWRTMKREAAALKAAQPEQAKQV